jgi:hypothetical protein
MADKADIKKIDFAEDAMVVESADQMPNIIETNGGADYYLRPVGLFTVMAATTPKGNRVAVLVMASEIDGKNRGHYLEIGANEARAMGAQFEALANDIEKGGTPIPKDPSSGTVN